MGRRRNWRKNSVQRFKKMLSVEEKENNVTAILKSIAEEPRPSTSGFQKICLHNNNDGNRSDENKSEALTVCTEIKGTGVHEKYFRAFSVKKITENLSELQTEHTESWKNTGPFKNSNYSQDENFAMKIEMKTEEEGKIKYLALEEVFITANKDGGGRNEKVLEPDEEPLILSGILLEFESPQFIGTDSLDDDPTYRAVCVKQLNVIDEDFVAVKPGIFRLALDISYLDDYRIIRTIYKTKEWEKAPKVFFSLEKRVFLYLDNLKTLTICKIFSLLLNMISDDLFIKENDFLMVAQKYFKFQVPSKFEIDVIAPLPEHKSHFRPGREMCVIRRFQNETFE